MVFKFAYFVAFTKAISLHCFSAVDCLGQVLQRDYKNTNDDVIMTSFHDFGILNFHDFVKLVISYQAANFQIPQLSESNFTEVFTKNKNYFYVIMTSLHNI